MIRKLQNILIAPLAVLGLFFAAIAALPGQWSARRQRRRRLDDPRSFRTFLSRFRVFGSPDSQAYFSVPINFADDVEREAARLDLSLIFERRDGWEHVRVVVARH
jgi:hypothetical protein